MTICVFRLARKNTNLAEDEMTQSNRGQGGHFDFGSKKHQACRGLWDLDSSRASTNSVQRLQRSRNCRSQLKVWAAILVFRFAQKQKLARGRLDLTSSQVLPNSLQRLQRRRRKCLGQSDTSEHCQSEATVWQSCFPIFLKKKKQLGRWCWDLNPSQVSPNSVKRLQRRKRK